MTNINFFNIITIAVILFLCSCGKEDEPTPKIIKTDAISFDSITLNESGFFNGSDGSGGFATGNAKFKTHFDSGPGWELWWGFAVTSDTNTIDPGYLNQYSSIAGSGAGGSKQYAILYSFSADTIEFIHPAKVTNIALSNSTYAYYTMKDGNTFSKKFGGVSGNDPDYFYLNIMAVDTSGNQKVFDPPVPLADFTFSDNSLDYISKKWEYYDLSSAGSIKYLIFSFSSSDTSCYGINTPTYVCIDNIIDEWEE